ncbi:hypothetical protein QYE76_019358 [Lolium multiflorum]|uniref:Integrase zinc-binding domain-containing protein n=1 Tax=Lolium multiflorum TaxID=4521 RepID=A0AAD8R4D1_LOLMU|nr:hypothetical protein QYE76_019358 [Lolium multiflorum]
MEIVIEGYEKDEQTKKLYAELCLQGSNAQGFALVDGVIRHQGKIWLGNHKEAQQAVLTALHNSGLGGHSGGLVTYHKVKQMFAWPHMKQDITKYVQHCTVCQQAKSEHTKLPGKLQPLPIPPEAWHTVGLDFIEGLPISGKYDTILVAVDKFTKFGHFIPLKHPFTAATVAQAFVDNVYCFHSIPKQAEPNGHTELDEWLRERVEMLPVILQPQQIIDERMIKRGSKEVPQVKVQWSGMPPSLQTWESVFAIVNEFPQAPAWGQAGTRGGGSVTTHYLTEALRIKRRTDYRQRMREAHIEAQA